MTSIAPFGHGHRGSERGPAHGPKVTLHLAPTRRFEGPWPDRGSLSGDDAIEVAGGMSQRTTVPRERSGCRLDRTIWDRSRGWTSQGAMDAGAFGHEVRSPAPRPESGAACPTS